MTQRVAVVGAGLTGCLLACFLARRAVPVTLYERRPDPLTGQVERGRSINLAISERGLDALRRIGLDGQVMADALPMPGRMIHPVAGELDFQPYSVSGDRAINSISRGALNNALLDAASKAAGVEVRFEHRLTGLDPRTGAMTFETPSGEVAESADVVLGADGAGSAVRAALVAAGVTRESVEFLGHGYKELTIPAVDGEFVLDPGALHIWPRGTSMMIALPNPDRSFTCTLFWPNEAFGALGTAAAVEEHFRAVYPDVVPLMPTLADDYAHNPVGVLGTVHAEPWQAYGRAGLIGDAAHAIVPFYGQGANCGFEDVVELDRCLDAAAGDYRADGAGELRRDARQGGVTGVPARQTVRARPRTRAARRLRVALRASVVLDDALRRGRAPRPPPAPGPGRGRRRTRSRRCARCVRWAPSQRPAMTRAARPVGTDSTREARRTLREGRAEARRG